MVGVCRRSLATQSIVASRLYTLAQSNDLHISDLNGGIVQRFPHLAKKAVVSQKRGRTFVARRENAKPIL